MFCNMLVVGRHRQGMDINEVVAERGDRGETRRRRRLVKRGPSGTAGPCRVRGGERKLRQGRNVGYM